MEIDELDELTVDEFLSVDHEVISSLTATIDSFLAGASELTVVFVWRLAFRELAVDKKEITKKLTTLTMMDVHTTSSWHDELVRMRERNHALTHEKRVASH